MKLAIAVGLMFLSLAESGHAQSPQSNGGSNHGSKEPLALAPDVAPESYAVIGANPVQEAALREQVRLMHPEVPPLRVFFVPHRKYLDNARIFHLHVPSGYTSLMFTHLPSRTIFIDNDRYQGEEWMGYWIGHELGHLKTSSAQEGDAEQAAREFRRRLKGRSKMAPQVRTATRVKNEK